MRECLAQTKPLSRSLTILLYVESTRTSSSLDTDLVIIVAVADDTLFLLPGADTCPDLICGARGNDLAEPGTETRSDPDEATPADPPWPRRPVLRLSCVAGLRIVGSVTSICAASRLSNSAYQFLCRTNPRRFIYLRCVGSKVTSFMSTRCLRTEGLSKYPARCLSRSPLYVGSIGMACLQQSRTNSGLQGEDKKSRRLTSRSEDA